MKKPAELILNSLKTLRRFVLDLAAILINVGRVHSYVLDPKLSQSYYPRQERKSGLRIYFENLWWLLKYKEINEFYYVYGFDLKNCNNQSEYFDYSGFRRLRNKANASARVAFRQVDYRCLLSDKFAFAQ